MYQIRMIMKFKEGYKVRSMAGENVVIMQGKAGSDMTRIISLNDSSLLLWNELQGKEFEATDVAEILISNYDRLLLYIVCPTVKSISIVCLDGMDIGNHGIVYVHLNFLLSFGFSESIYCSISD